jgi:AraC-like DNA-binding protein
MLRMVRHTGIEKPRGSSFFSTYGFVASILMTVLFIAQMVPANRSFGARNGVIEAAGASSTHAVLRLRGEWELYWGRLLRPADFLSGSPPAPDAAVWLPSTWTKTRIDGRPLPSVGDATFRLEVRHPWAGRALGIKLTRINSAFELYADSSLIASGGTLSDAPGGFSGAFAPQTAFFTPASGATVLTLRVSNRIPGAWSGPVEEIDLGPREAIERETGGSIIADAFNVSGRLFLAAFFLALYLLLGSRLAAVYSATAMVMAAHNATVREMVLLRLLPGLDLGLLIRIQISSSLAVLICLLFTFETFLRERSGGAASRIRNGVLVAAAATCAALLLYFCLAGDSVYLRFFTVFIPPILLLFIYYSALVFRDAAKRRVGPAEAAVFLLLFFYTSYEILSMFRVVDLGRLYPLFFLRSLPRLAPLAATQLPQGLVSYLDIAAISLYFAYDILRRRFGREGLAARAGGEAPAADAAETKPRAQLERPGMEDPRESAMIRERVDKAIDDPGVLGNPDLDIRSLAAIVKMPPYRLSIWFNACLETSFPAWLNARRIELAKRLMIEHPGRTIIDIAMEAGYASKSAFNEQFKRATGSSPSEWRRGNKGASKQE